MKSLVLYAYHDSEQARENLEFFQEFGMYVQSDVDYILCVNGDDSSTTKSARWKRVITRENEGYDFGAWRESLRSVNCSEYDYFVFLNNTIRGPFGERYWIRTFCDLLDDQVKLAGITINCHTGIYKHYYKEQRKSVPHVQSMFWCTDQIGLEIIRPILDRTMPQDKDLIVIEQEIGISQAILASGYNIRSILKQYDADYTKGDILINTDNGMAYGDPWYLNSFFKRSLHPYETIFFKTNRGVDEKEVEKCTKIQLLNKWY